MRNLRDVALLLRDIALATVSRVGLGQRRRLPRRARSIRLYVSFAGVFGGLVGVGLSRGCWGSSSGIFSPDECGGADAPSLEPRERSPKPATTDRETSHLR